MSRHSFSPDWSDSPPPPGSYRSIFKWGAPDGFKHPNQRLYEMLKSEFRLSDADFRSKHFEGREPVVCERPMGLRSDQIQAIEKIVGAVNVSASDYDRVKFASGKTMEEAIRLRQGLRGEVADLVVHPRHKTDVCEIVAYCDREKVPVTVYGGGSSVTLGLQAARGGITLVMGTHMNRVLSFNETNQTVTVEPGLMGPALEAILNQAPEKLKARRRYTCGHFPQSFEYSSVGGWIVTLGSGQASSYYGDMYDIVLSQEYVTPRGSFQTIAYPGTATGPKVNDIMKGNEGAFGILVGATLKVFRHTPRNRRRFAFIFSDWEAAVSAAREISQGEFGMPAVFRISDAEETNVGLKLYGIEGTLIDRLISRRGFRPSERCLCIGTTEGEKGFTANVKHNVKRICNAHGAMYLTGLPEKNWEHGRFRDPYMREDLNDYGIMIDTLETGVTWDRIHAVHQGVRRFIKNRPRTVCMTHASHFYPQGTNLYFIFIAKMNELAEYKAFQEGIIDSIERCGGSLSHHHGVGKMIGPWMERHLGKEQMDILRTLKRHFDPNNILNPGGTLGLDLSAENRR